MSFNTYFRLTSYASVAAAAFALFIGGGVGLWLMGAFVLLMIVAWTLEDSRWQLTERVALAVILFSIPIFYLDWRVITPFLVNAFAPSAADFGSLNNSLNQPGARGTVEVSVLSHLILFLSSIKLLQRKADRDWFFLYLIAFFTVLLSAGLTASPLFLAMLIAYLLCALSTVVAFEIQKARKKVAATQTRLLVQPDSRLFQTLPMRFWRRRYLETRRLPFVSVGLLVVIFVLALPFFLIAPRTASSALRRGGNGVSGFIGFSDNVLLGQIGELKGNDEIFMHVRMDNVRDMPRTGLRWRGVALDEFTGHAWRKSTAASRFQEMRDDRGFYKIATTEDVSRLTQQTFFLQPVDTPVLFGAPRILAVQGKLPYVRVDSEGSIQTRPHDQERVRYDIYSDTTEPNVRALRADRLQYSTDSARYLELPVNLDRRIADLAARIIQTSGAHNGYDAALATEAYLRENFGYSLELRAGGRDPLASFLFDVRTGHCEYFSTAMAVMLRTQGIATRVVNGFLPGEYNEAAGAYTVRQSDAHSWVEVYFPQTKAWVTFDPTPSAGRTGHMRTGFAGALSKYSEALELIWFQYIVGYDKQEQHSLLTSVRKQLFDFQRYSVDVLSHLRDYLPSILRITLIVLGVAAAVLLAFLMAKRIRKFGWRRGLRIWERDSITTATRIEFYERLVRALEKRGIKREVSQTPLEFAAAVGYNEAQAITSAYNRVRFGRENLSPGERDHIEQLLLRLEANGKPN